LADAICSRNLTEWYNIEFAGNIAAWYVAAVKRSAVTQQAFASSFYGTGELLDYLYVVACSRLSCLGERWQYRPSVNRLGYASEADTTQLLLSRSNLIAGF
jgi:hypothetical protein